MTHQEQLEAILEPWLDEVRSEYGNGSHDSRKPQFKAIEEAKQAITALMQEAFNDGRVAECRLFLKNGNPDMYLKRALKDRIKQLSGGSNNE